MIVNCEHSGGLAWRWGWWFTALVIAQLSAVEVDPYDRYRATLAERVAERGSVAVAEDVRTSVEAASDSWRAAVLAASLVRVEHADLMASIDTLIGQWEANDLVPERKDTSIVRGDQRLLIRWLVEAGLSPDSRGLPAELANSEARRAVVLAILGEMAVYRWSYAELAFEGLLIAHERKQATDDELARACMQLAANRRHYALPGHALRAAESWTVSEPQGAAAALSVAAEAPNNHDLERLVTAVEAVLPLLSESLRTEIAEVAGPRWPELARSP